MAKKRFDIETLDSKEISPLDRRREMIGSFVRGKGKTTTIVIHFRGDTVRIPKRKLREIITRRVTRIDLMHKELESQLALSYSFLMKTIKDSYPIDPEKGITIISPVEPNPNEDNPVIDLPALGSLTKEEIMFLNDCIEKKFQDLDLSARNQFKILFAKLSPLVDVSMKEESAKAETSKKTETESDVLDEQEDSKEK